MATYKYGGWTQWDGVEYYAIHKRTFWGTWSEVVWWHYTESGRKQMMKAVKQLKKKGHIVL